MLQNYNHFLPFLSSTFFITWPTNATTQIHYWFKWKQEKQSAKIVTKVKHDICSALCTESEKRIIFYAQIYYEGLNGVYCYVLFNAHILGV